MDIPASAVKEVRAKTNAGMLDCRKALERSNGDINGAIEALRQKGFAMAEKRASRSVGEGVVAAYLWQDCRRGDRRPWDVCRRAG